MFKVIYCNPLLWLVCVKQVLITVHAKLELSSINVLSIYRAKMTGAATFFRTSHTNVKNFIYKVKRNMLRVGQNKIVIWGFGNL